MPWIVNSMQRHYIIDIGDQQCGVADGIPRSITSPRGRPGISRRPRRERLVCSKCGSPQLHKTGDIEHVKDMAVWVNPENSDMMMDRILGKTISAKIRYLGANKDEDGGVVEDTIAEELRSAADHRARGVVTMEHVMSTSCSQS